MIKVKLLSPGIYRVTEIVQGWNRDKITDWFYDMDKLLISETRDFKEGDRTRKLTASQVDRFNKYHKPKALDH